MLEIVVQAAIGTLVLALAVQLGLWTLGVRRPKPLLSIWTAVLIASIAMPAILSAMSPFGAGAVRASEPHWISAGSKWPTGLYLIVTALLALRLLWGLTLSLKMLRATRPVAADWAIGNRLRTSTWIGGPVTIGSHMLLPAECVNWDARRRRAVLAHQAARVARGDFYVQLLSQIHRSVFWFSPLAWWLHRRLTALSELASDDAAIAALGDRPSYAAMLRDLARLPRISFMGVAMARPATAHQRIARLSTDEQPNASLSYDAKKQEFTMQEFTMKRMAVISSLAISGIVLSSDFTTASAAKMDGRCCASSDGGRSYRCRMAMMRAASVYSGPYSGRQYGAW
jgi:beta-lactamase regulating signal transducer with metallopeptidase domain